MNLLVDGETFTALSEATAMTVMKSSHNASKHAPFLHVCNTIAAECKSCSNLQCQDPVLAG